MIFDEKPFNIMYCKHFILDSMFTEQSRPKHHGGRFGSGDAHEAQVSGDANGVEPDARQGKLREVLCANLRG